MKLFFASSFLFLAACGIGIKGEKQSSPSPPETFAADASLPPMVSSPEGSLDAAIYQLCDHQELEMVEGYTRLRAEYCVDTNGTQMFQSYWDTLLSINCLWKMGTDKRIRCLPLNQASAFLYGDPSCAAPIGFAEMKDGKPVSPYLGLDIFNGDAGTTSVEEFVIGSPFTGDTMFYRSEGNCLPTFALFKNAKPFWVSNVIDPILFLEK